MPMSYSLSFFARRGVANFWDNLSADDAFAAAKRAESAGCKPNWIHGGTVHGVCTQYVGPSVGEVLANLTRYDRTTANKGENAHG